MGQILPYDKSSRSCLLLCLVGKCAFSAAASHHLESVYTQLNLSVKAPLVHL